MVSGGIVCPEVRAEDVSILRHLINDSLNKAAIKEAKSGKEQAAESKKLFDVYIYSTFWAFSQNKTQITLSLEDIFNKSKVI